MLLYSNELLEPTSNKNTTSFRPPSCLQRRLDRFNLFSCIVKKSLSFLVLQFPPRYILIYFKIAWPWSRLEVSTVGLWVRFMVWFVPNFLQGNQKTNKLIGLNKLGYIYLKDTEETFNLAKCGFSPNKCILLASEHHTPYFQVSRKVMKQINKKLN